MENIPEYAHLTDTSKTKSTLYYFRLKSISFFIDQLDLLSEIGVVEMKRNAPERSTWES